MAFECKVSTEIYLTKNSEDTIEVKPSHIVSSGKSLLFDSETVITESGKPRNLVNQDYSRVITTPCGAKLAVDECLFNGRRTITDLPPALISEIFNCLDPKELGVVSCVSPSLYRIASDHHVWKEFYCERWGLPAVPISLTAECSDDKSWKELFVEREFRSKTFMGRYSIDILYGHAEAVRTVFLLPSRKLVFTSGYDSVIRMWDMEDGLSITSSRPLGCTIRAVAADSKLLVAGGSDGFIHGWRAEEGHPHLFDIKGSQNQNTEFRLWEHEGPITCLALDLSRIYSGSWDMTIRIWDRLLLKCLTVLMHNDWVWCLVPHDTTVVSTSGSDVYIWGTNSGSLIDIIKDTHVATWSPHSGPVYSLAFEFPWLVSASSDGKLSLIDVRKLLKSIRRSSSTTSVLSQTNCGRLKTKPNRIRHSLNGNNSDRNNVEPPQRMLHGPGCSLFAVGIGADRIVCGGEEGTVRIWNFSQALEIEKRVSALRALRFENRMRRRKLQNEIDSKGSRADQCLIAAKNQMNGERNGVWYNKRGLTRKVKG
ncbi:F-box/WD-40 repeat-containing protein At5g21040 isoform X2 [Cynara cardunculus var. scolymus]|uniref:F-box/WD-40 repeat-containing protein At5g21040 isoform X2 n=1 Tax=Cynara cardunculus var. scolymus TaxID=59895 RepID=UPI000D62E469|nr:F-box/WD-40 repeat-containing protein At5g21040 isoform X2 [Cynara cardunculus var. scolymus]